MGPRVLGHREKKHNQRFFHFIYNLIYKISFILENHWILPTSSQG